MSNFTKKQSVHSVNTPQTGIKRYILFGLFAACLCQPCLANPIAMDFEDMIWGPGGTASDISRILLTDLLIDLSVLVVGFILIRRVRCLKSIRFVPYLIVVVLGGLMIDEAALFVKQLVHPSNQMNWIMLDSTASLGEEPHNGFWGISVLTFLLLAAFNYFLCWAFFRLQHRKTIVIAVLMGFLTHPDLYSAYSWMPITGVLLFLLCCAYVREPHHAKKIPTTSQQGTSAISAVKANRYIQETQPKPEIGFPE